jgi:predicted Zn-dependent peptidase|tara:strand:+ start:370 stop:1641 length:1272 start_codon:yes stop_codon:yes gene_type:complete
MYIDMYEIIKIEGFCVLLNHLPKTKTFKVEAMIGDGFINETKANSGIAHFVEHIVSESWKQCFKDGCAKFWTDYGTLYNAETTDNIVMYYVEGFVKDIDIMLDYICKVVADPNIPRARLKKEKKAVVNEVMRTPNVEVDLYNKANQVVFKNEGLVYNSDRNLQVENLKKFDLKAVKDWIDNNYCRNNTIFVISGNFDKEKVIKKMKPILKKKKHSNNCPLEPRDLFHKGTSITYVPAPRKKDANILFLFPYTLDKPNLNMVYADFFQLFIDGSIQSIMMYELREKRELIYTSDTFSQVYPFSGLLTVDLSTKQENILEVIKEATKVLQDLKDGKFSKKSLDNLKKQFLLTHHMFCDNNDFYTRFFGIQLMNQLDTLDKDTKIYTYDEIVEFINNLTKKDFVKFIKKILDFDNMKIVYQSAKEV